MSASNRDFAISKILEYEGGYTNDAADPGGPTNWGITIFDAKMYLKPSLQTTKPWRAEDIAYMRAMPKSDAIEIYRKRYWNKMGCDADPAGVDLVTADYGVNSGVGRAVPCRAKNENRNIVEWVKGICSDRLQFLQHLRIWANFGKGWGRRVADVKATGVTMALKAQNLPAADVKAALKKEEDKSSTKAKQNLTAGTGTTAAPASTQIPDAPHHVDVTTMDWSAIIMTSVSVAVIAVVAYYFFWRWRQHRNDAQAFAAAAKTV